MARLNLTTECELCGCIRQTLRYRLGQMHVVKCQGCGLVFVHPSSRDSRQEQLYGADYFRMRGEYFLQASEGHVSGLSGEHIESFQRGLRLIETRKKAGNLLDVGCAVGVFLSVAERSGWKTYGLDVSEYATSVARQHCKGEIHTGELGEVRFPEAFFDVITLWDVVEHLSHPKIVLQEVHRILKPDGWILLDTPNEGCLLRKVAYGAYQLSRGVLSYPASRLYHIYHAYYFSETTLRMLLDQCGFEVVHLIRKSIPREKGRGTPVERTVVKFVGFLEGVLGMDFELLVLARKRSGSIVTS